MNEKTNENTNSRNDSERDETNKFTQYKCTQSRLKLMMKSLKSKKNIEKDSHKLCNLGLEWDKAKLEWKREQSHK